MRTLGGGMTVTVRTGRIRHSGFSEMLGSVP